MTEKLSLHFSFWHSEDRSWAWSVIVFRICMRQTLSQGFVCFGSREIRRRLRTHTSFMYLLANGRGCDTVRCNLYYRPHQGLSWDWAHSWMYIIVWLFGLLSSASHISSCNLLKQCLCKSVQFSHLVMSNFLRPPWTAARQASLSIICTQILAQSLLPANERPTFSLQALSFMTETTFIFH